MASERLAHRIYIDVLATEEQIRALQELIGTALCTAPFDHGGPCRIAWSLHHSSEQPDGDQEGALLTADDVTFIREELAPVEVWAPEAVDQSLGLTY